MVKEYINKLDFKCIHFFRPIAHFAGCNSPQRPMYTRVLSNSNVSARN